MDIIACGSRPSRRMGLRRASPERCGRIRSSRRPIPRCCAPAGCASSRARARSGIRHPLGQTLHITSGIGHVQTWGGPIRQGARRRHGLDSAGREALARRNARARHGTHRHAGSAERRARKMARGSDGRAISRQVAAATSTPRERRNSGTAPGLPFQWRGDGPRRIREVHMTSVRLERAAGGRPGTFLRGAGDGAAGQYERSS